MGSLGNKHFVQVVDRDAQRMAEEVSRLPREMTVGLEVSKLVRARTQGPWNTRRVRPQPGLWVVEEQRLKEEVPLASKEHQNSMLQ